MATCAPPCTLSVRRLDALYEPELQALVDILIDCVDGGASVGFMLPLMRSKALTFWSKVAASVASGDRAVLVAEDAQGIVGTVQVIFAQPENQPHRADVAKMLVQRRGRRKGVGAELMRAAERVALAAGKTLLVLDTADETAARLYTRLGWQPAGTIPRYALLPQGGECATTYFYRSLVD